MSKRTRRNPNKMSQRRGAVAVELAFCIPVLLFLLFSMLEVCRLYNINNNLMSAVRQGARLAAMDREGMLNDGQTMNDKVTKDVKNFLRATGMDTDKVDVRICHPDEPDREFLLDDPENSLKNFELRVEVPYADTTSIDFPGADDFKLGAKIVFRNSRGSLTGG